MCEMIRSLTPESTTSTIETEETLLDPVKSRERSRRWDKSRWKTEDLITSPRNDLKDEGETAGVRNPTRECSRSAWENFMF